MAGGITFGTCKRKRAAWVRRATSNARSARQVGFPSRQYSVVRGWPRVSADHRLHREVGGFGGRPQQIQQAGHQQPRAGAYERRAVFVAWGTGGLLRFLHACRRGVRHSNGYCNGSRGASRGVAGMGQRDVPWAGVRDLKKGSIVYSETHISCEAMRMLPVRGGMHGQGL